MASLSHILSAVESIDNMSVHAIPAKPLKNVTAIRIDRTVVLLDKNGRVYSTQVNGNFAFLPGDNRAAIRETIIGAARLGAISEKAMEEDLQLRQAAALERDKQFAAHQIVQHANSLGIKFTEAHALASGGRWQGMYRIGKKAAGRLLDGRTWDEVPS